MDGEGILFFLGFYVSLSLINLLDVTTDEMSFTKKNWLFFFFDEL